MYRRPAAPQNLGCQAHNVQCQAPTIWCLTLCQAPLEKLFSGLSDVIIHSPLFLQRLCTYSTLYSNSILQLHTAFSVAGYFRCFNTTLINSHSAMFESDLKISINVYLPFSMFNTKKVSWMSMTTATTSKNTFLIKQTVFPF